MEGSTNNQRFWERKFLESIRAGGPVASGMATPFAPWALAPEHGKHTHSMKPLAPTSETLDQSPEEFERLLARAQSLVLDRYANLDSEVHPGHSVSEVKSWFAEPLPEVGMDPLVLMEEVRDKILDPATLNIGPNMYSYVMAGGNQVAIAGDLIASAINQNVAKWHLAPAATEMEIRVIQWAADFVRYDRGESVGGAIVSSGSAANLTGLNVARNICFERDGIRERGLFGQPPYVVYASTETHGSVDKSIDMLGIGTDNLRKISVDAGSRMDMDELRESIRKDRAEGRAPFCVIGNAGTVNTGAIDPLSEIADVCAAEGLWFHVDGAYGGLAASIPDLSEEYQGLERADSLALDFHKWLYQPFEIGCVLVRNWGHMRRTFFRSASYLDSAEPDLERFDINEHHFELSRNGKALKVWMSFKAFGAERLRRQIMQDIRLSEFLASKLSASAHFEVVTSGPLAIVTFRFIGGGEHSEEEIDLLNRRMVPALELDRRVFLTGTKLGGRPVLRACVINHRKTSDDIGYLVAVLEEVGAAVEAQS